MTAAFVVTWQGRLIAERYGDDITATHTTRELVDGQEPERNADGGSHQAGRLRHLAAGADSRMAEPGDPRAQIRIVDILHMSSGLRISAPQDPDYDPAGPYPDHLYLYTGSVNSFKYAATRPQQWPPNTVGRYRNTDPVLDQLSDSPRGGET